MTTPGQNIEPHIYNPYLGGAVCRDADAAYLTDRPHLSRCPACRSAWDKHERRRKQSQGIIASGRATECKLRS